MALPLEKTCEFQTTPTRAPLVVNIVAHCITPHGLEGNALRLHVNVCGLMHPHAADTNYIGNAAKNPAVLPAGKRLLHILTQALNDEIQNTPALNAASYKTLGGDDHYSTNSKGADSYTASADFNMSAQRCAHHGTSGYTPITETHIAALHTAMGAAVEKARPEIEKLLLENAHLQPPENPTPKQVRNVEKKVENAWAKSMSLLEKTGNARARTGSPKPDYGDN